MQTPRPLNAAAAIAIAAAASLTLHSSAHAAAKVFTQATAGTYDWNTAGNWVAAGLPGTGDTADFRDGGLSGAGEYTVSLSADAAAVDSIRFGTGSTAANKLTKNLTITGSTLTITGTGVGTDGLNYNANNTAAVTINSALNLAGDLFFTVSAPASGTNFLTINGVIGETGGIRNFNKGNGGTLKLTGANTFSGSVLVQNGILDISTIAALGTGSSTVTLGNATSASTINAQLRYSGAADATLGRSLVVQSTNTGGGRIEITTAGTTFTLASTTTITGNGRFQFGGTGNVAVDAQVATTGTNPIIKSGSGTGWLTNVLNSYATETITRNGTLIVPAAAALGNSSGITLADSASDVDANPTFLTAGNFTVAQNITVNANNPSGLSTVGGAATQTGSSTFAGAVTLNRSLQITSSTAAGSAVTFAGVISDGTGTFGLTKIGGGTAVLSNANNGYKGATNVTAGTLVVGAATAVPAASAVTVGGGADSATLKIGTTANSSLASLTVNANGKVDLGLGGITVSNGGGATNLAAFAALVTAGRAGGAGVFTSNADASHDVGYIDTGTTIQARYTILGDANLDGAVDFNDFLVLQTNFGSTGAFYGAGDFNYDGTVDFNDFLVLQTDFGQSLGGDNAVAVVTAEQVAALTAFGVTHAVPEPAAMAVLGLLATTTLARRRAY